jgi:hypothetical protein
MVAPRFTINAPRGSLVLVLTASGDALLAEAGDTMGGKAL